MADGDAYEADPFKKKSIKIEVLVSASKTSFEVVIYIISNQSDIICPNYEIVKLI